MIASPCRPARLSSRSVRSGAYLSISLLIIEECCPLERTSALYTAPAPVLADPRGMRAPGRGGRESAGFLQTSLGASEADSHSLVDAAAASTACNTKPLNPFAQEFLPRAVALQQGGLAEKVQRPAVTAQPSSPSAQNATVFGGTSLADLPDEVCPGVVTSVFQTVLTPVPP